VGHIGAQHAWCPGNLDAQTESGIDLIGVAPADS
jgi:hypothetical protein